MPKRSSEYWLAKAEELRTTAEELDEKIERLGRTRRVNPHLDAEVEAIREAQQSLVDRARMWESMASHARGL